MPLQLKTLNKIDVSVSLYYILSKTLFLVKDIIINQERIFLFTITANIQHLSQTLFWIIDDTFKIILTVFYQLYTIYVPIGVKDNSKILSLIYALITNKSEELYKQNLINFAKENNIELNLSTIIINFK